MAKNYKMQRGSSKHIYDVLTVEDDGRMTVTFHGNDRVKVTEDVSEADGEWSGWLRVGGSMYPGLQSGRWTEVSESEAAETHVIAEPKAVTEPSMAAEPQTVAVPHPAASGTAVIQALKNQKVNSKLKFVGLFAASIVAMGMLVETGLFLPVGVAGLIVGGFIK